MNKKISLGTAIALIALAVALAVTLTMMFSMERFSATVTDVNQRQSLLDYLTEVDKKVREEYSGTIDEIGLREAVAASYLSGIGDPYADYLTADEYAAVEAVLKGEAEGFGLTVEYDQNAELVVRAVATNSPSALAGMQVGDIVRVVNDTAVGTELTLLDVQDLLATAGKVQLTVTREGEEQSFSLISAVYTLESVSGKMLDNSIGYIRITNFSDITFGQFETLYESLRSQGAIGFIFDLRGNAGGSLAATQQVLEILLPNATYATLKRGDKIENLTSKGTTEVALSSVTLINGSTSGEAELFAGALTEFNKTKLVGTASHGCAMVQEYFALTSTNARIKLSVGELSLPKSGSWQGKGLTPMKEVSSFSAELSDPQLVAAQELLLGSNMNTVTTTTTTATTTGTTTTTAPESEE
ncbi:MAG: PDZ domain-containing protein [Clostridia bacterium]|nr:PDZ domain-containing protein [Clostridia bacterium]